jgi:hypothetical protein
MKTHETPDEIILDPQNKQVTCPYTDKKDQEKKNQSRINT